jgi:hypothetical protein
MESQGGGRRPADWQDRGKLEGKLQIGKLEGEARALQRLLSQRFGAIPMDIGERIAAADLAQVEAWFDAALTAPDMASVFTPTQN